MMKFHSKNDNFVLCILLFSLDRLRLIKEYADDQKIETCLLSRNAAKAKIKQATHS